jgi:hypothetical protein
VSEVPEPLLRLEALIAAQRIAHETIYEFQHALADVNRATSRSADLLAESTRITLRDAFVVASTMRQLASRWHEQSVLDPDAAETTAATLEDEFARIEPQLRGFLSRQREIAAELRALLAEGD